MIGLASCQGGRRSWRLAQRQTNQPKKITPMKCGPSHSFFSIRSPELVGRGHPWTSTSTPVPCASDQTCPPADIFFSSFYKPDWDDDEGLGGAAPKKCPDRPTRIRGTAPRGRHWARSVRSGVLPGTNSKKRHLRVASCGLSHPHRYIRSARLDSIDELSVQLHPCDS